MVHTPSSKASVGRRESDLALRHAELRPAAGTPHGASSAPGSFFLFSFFFAIWIKITSARTWHYTIQSCDLRLLENRNYRTGRQGERLNQCSVLRADI